MKEWLMRRVGDLRLERRRGRWRALLLVGAAGILLSGSQSRAEPSAPTAWILTGAWLIDGTGAAPVADAWVRIEGDRIAEVGEGSPPEDPRAKRVDIRGRTVLPGLADMHFHLGSRKEIPWQLKFALAHGVTVLRDVGTGTPFIEMPTDVSQWQFEDLADVPPEQRELLTAQYHWEVLPWVRHWLNEQESAPHFYSAGVMPYGWPPLKRFLRPGDHTQALLNGNLAAGVDFIKVHQWVSSEALSQAVAFAETNGLYVVGHVPTGMSSVGAIDAGLRTLEHVRLRPWEVIDDPVLIGRYPVDLPWPRRDAFWAHFDPKSASLARTLDAWERRKDRFFLDPTLVEWEWETCDYPRKDDPVLDLIPPDERERLTDCSPQMAPETLEEIRESLAGVIRFVGLAHARGIPIITGTDVWSVPGASLLREFELLVRAGFSPVEVIHASTGRAAEALGLVDRGTVEPGMIADLLIVRGNVAKDIGNLRALETVILGGRRFDRDKLLREASQLASMSR